MMLSTQKNVSEKRLRIDIGALKELIVQHKSTGILWTKIKNQLADCLAKCTADKKKTTDMLTLLFPFVFRFMKRNC